MEKCKKISLVIIMLILLGCVFIGKSYAEIRCSVGLTATNEGIQGEEISVYAKISNLQTTKGIITIGTTLGYDNKNLTLIKIEGQNGWSPMYNAENGKIAIVRDGFATTDENVIKMTFKVSEGAETSAWVKLDNFQIADGDEERDIGGAMTTISIKAKAQQQEPSTPPTTNQGNSSSNNNNNKPSTGNNKPSTGNNKPNTNNNIIEIEQPTNNEPNTNEVNETNTNTNENVENKNSVNFEINENFNFKSEEYNEDTAKNATKTKGVTYAICIGGVVIATAIMFIIIKSSGKDE